MHMNTSVQIDPIFSKVLVRMKLLHIQMSDAVYEVKIKNIRTPTSAFFKF